MSGRKKLIEVALPLEAINAAASVEKSIRHGHPSTLHTWWARRPLAVCRAILLASLVDDPSARREEFPTEDAQNKERQRLFRLIEELVKWENTTNEAVLEAARSEIRNSMGSELPTVLDPFCGGGSIPLEAQRLGLSAHASDLNPVAVLITKALVEIPALFSGMRPVNPEARGRPDFSRSWARAEGLASDIRYYGGWLVEEARRRFGSFYPNVLLPGQQGEAPVIAWLWARTVSCPNPACGVETPLVRSFWLSRRKANKAWAEPVVDEGPLTFRIQSGTGEPREGTVTRKGAICVRCEIPFAFRHIREEGGKGRLGERLMACVASRGRLRLFVPPDQEQLRAAAEARPTWEPDHPLPPNPRDFKTPNYGMTRFADLFTPRQLVTLGGISDLVQEARQLALSDASEAGFSDDQSRLHAGGKGAAAYSDAIAAYLGLVASKATVFSNSLARWRPNEAKSAPAFGRQALPMVWDYAEINPFAAAGGDLSGIVNGAAKAIESTPAGPPSRVRQLDATVAVNGVQDPVVCTDPPYYDNIGYADLSDFFYLWLRKSIGDVFPGLFSTLLTPKDQELVATPHRFEGVQRDADRFFEEGLRRAFQRIRETHSGAVPMTLFYAFKQAESPLGEDPIAALVSTGWETMLDALVNSGFLVSGTWPTRTEGGTRMMALDKNALASSIVLVCRPRPEDAPIATRQEFLRALHSELPGALKNLQRGNIAPVDLAQASIGPGMAVFSRYTKVVEADGTAMKVGTALGIINQVLSEVLTEQEEQYDAPTRWAVSWFEQHGMKEGPYGDAEVLSKAKATALEAMSKDGFLRAKAGKVAIVPHGELPDGWDPATDPRLTIWEATQYLIRVLEERGEQEAARLLRRLGPATGETARDLAYRLYVVCERKKWADEALAYNSLVVAWPEIVRLAASEPEDVQESLPQE